LTTTRRFSYLARLECSGCARLFDINQIQTYCPDCQAPILAHYDLDNVRRNLDRTEVRLRYRGMWRWHELLPVQEPEQIVTLGEGDTPLLLLRRLQRELGLQKLFLKDEGLNPTGSFKARGLAAAISRARELGVQKVIIPTAGNAGGAMAAYASRAGMQAHIFMPKDSPLANVEESRMTGATVILIDGLISEAAGMAGEKARAEGWFDVSTFKEPYRAEGKKVMGYEIADSFDWDLPDVIIYPAGGGTGLVGIWKAFDELEEMGWLRTPYRPRMVAVQAAGCAPIVKAYENGAIFCDYWHGAHTLASGLRVPKSFADQLIMQTIRESKGSAIAVSDEEIVQAQKRLGATEGVFAAPEGAATLAALFKMLDSHQIDPKERIVLMNTGMGQKYVTA